MVNTGVELEKMMLEKVKSLVQKNEFLVTNPYVFVKEKPKYYSKDRDSFITFDISVEKYVKDPNIIKEIKPSLLIIIECKDYQKSISVDDVEEFHAKLEQIGTDKTKGIMITREATYQKSTLSYAESLGITLARLLPDEQIEYILYRMLPWEFEQMMQRENNRFNREKALTSKEFLSKNGQEYFDTYGNKSIEERIESFLK